MYLPKLTITLLSIFILTISFHTAQAGHKSKAPYYTNDTSQWLIEIPLWVPGFRGQLAYGGVDFFSNDQEAKEHERLSSKLGIEFYFSGRVMFRKNKFWTQLDAFSGTVSNTYKYTSLIGNHTSDIVKLTAQGTIPRLSIGYSVFSKQKGDYLDFEIIPYVGVRYNHIRFKSDVLNNTDILDVRPNWVEPIFGLYMPINYKRFKILLQTDVGGVNQKSTWIFNSHFRYRISKLIDVSIGWTALNIHYDQQFKNEDLSLNIRLRGPNAGVGFRF